MAANDIPGGTPSGHGQGLEETQAPFLFPATSPHRQPMAALYHYTATFDPETLIRQACRYDLHGEPGFVTNFIGVRIRPEIMPSVLEGKVGTVEAPPDPGNWHADIAEWGAAFHAVQAAGETFRMVELGCGWGCWMNITGVYARSLGKKVELIGIEGDGAHLEHAAMVLRDNGFSDGEYRLEHGVAGPKEGTALFPLADVPSETWGGEAVFYPEPDRREELMASGRYVELPCRTLKELSGDRPLDLLHIDIQGAEASFVRGNMADLDGYVRRVLIGTHSRPIEGELTDHLVSSGWALEIDRPALFRIVDGVPRIRIDGVQMWRNRALEADESDDPLEQAVKAARPVQN